MYLAFARFLHCVIRQAPSHQDEYAKPSHKAIARPFQKSATINIIPFSKATRPGKRIRLSVQPRERNGLAKFRTTLGVPPPQLLQRLSDLWLASSSSAHPSCDVLRRKLTSTFLASWHARAGACKSTVA